MNRMEIIVFFDESGKRDKPALMGALAMPRVVYERQDLQALLPFISHTKIHWTQYNGDSKERRLITKIINRLSSYESMVRFNVINYNHSILEQLEDQRELPKGMAEMTIYTKFPERIVYGLLRKYGEHVHLIADLFIEEASEYIEYRLHEKIKEQLNVQSLYRGERYRIRSSAFRPKGQEIGLECTDILLGIVRTIIKNDDLSQSKSKREKILLTLRLLQNPLFYKLLTNIKYFEWSNSIHLNEVDFSNYLHVFLSKHHELWIEADPQQKTSSPV